jgi:hypothetical protein
MRPKIVLLTLVVLVGLVAAMVILKGARQQVVVTPTPLEDAGAQQNPPGNPSEPGSTNIAGQVSVDDTQTMVQKITDIQAEGVPTPQGRAVLLAALTEGKDKEVRQAALNAIVQLDDTAAIPGMEQALAQIADPREKTALMDAVEQLKLPSTTPAVAVSGNMRSRRPPGVKITPNPRFAEKSRRATNPSSRTTRPSSQPATAPDAGQPQPPVQTPDAGQPQPPAQAPDAGQPQSPAPQ